MWLLSRPNDTGPFGLLIPKVWTTTMLPAATARSSSMPGTRLPDDGTTPRSR